MHQIRHPLFGVVVRRKAIVLLVVGIHTYVHFAGIKDTLRHLTGSSKPCSISPNYFKGRMGRIISQSNNKYKGRWRKGLCQEDHLVPRIFARNTS